MLVLALVPELVLVPALVLALEQAVPAVVLVAAVPSAELGEDRAEAQLLALVAVAPAVELASSAAVEFWEGNRRSLCGPQRAFPALAVS